jgi:signal transduction histidine kinase
MPHTMPHTFTQKLVDHTTRLDRAQLERYLLRTARQGEFLRVILDTMTEGVLAVNAVNTVVYANASIQDLTGVAARDAVKEPLDACLRDPALCDAVMNAGCDAYISIEVTITYPRRLSLMVQIIPLQHHDADKEWQDADEPAYLILLRDVSSQRSQYSAKERASRLETLRLLTSGVAHELGNPLSAIILHSQLMARRLASAPRNKDMGELRHINQVIHDESMRLKRIVGDFLNAVRPTSLKLERGSLNDLIEETFELLYSELNERNVAVIKSLGDTPDTLFDCDQMRSVIINIVRNAMDAMPDGGALAVALAAHGDWLNLTFKDDGCGIEPDRLARVFTPFYTTKPHGSGLGLLIAQRIVNAHGGALRIQSVPGQGTAVIIELPVRLTPSRKSLPSPQKKKRP